MRTIFFLTIVFSFIWLCWISYPKYDDSHDFTPGQLEQRSKSHEKLLKAYNKFVNKGTSEMVYLYDEKGRIEQ